jgi:hypothetical protein
MTQFSIANLTDTTNNGVHTITVGKGTKEMTTEAALVSSPAFAKLFLASVPTMLAFDKAAHGNYRAAVEIMALGADKATMTFLQPKPGQQWKKGSVLTLAEKVLDRESGAKGYTKKQLVARSLAKAITDKLSAAAAVIEEAAAQTTENLTAGLPVGE